MTDGAPTTRISVRMCATALVITSCIFMQSAISQGTTGISPPASRFAAMDRNDKILGSATAFSAGGPSSPASPPVVTAPFRPLGRG